MLQIAILNKKGISNTFRLSSYPKTNFMKKNYFLALLFFPLLFSCVDSAQDTPKQNITKQNSAKQATARKATAKQSNETVESDCVPFGKVFRVNKVKFSGKGNDEMVTVNKNGGTLISGWAMDKSRKGAPERVFLHIGQTTIKASTGLPSDYLVKLVKNPNAKNVGFVRNIPNKLLKKGINVVSFSVLNKDGSKCMSNQKVKLKVN